MTARRAFFGLLLVLLGAVAALQNFASGLRPDHWPLWDVFGICSLLALGLALLATRAE